MSKIHIVVDPYAVISRAVEEGISYGVNRAHKHTDTPSRDDIADAVYRGVMNALCEVVNWESDIDE